MIITSNTVEHNYTIPQLRIIGEVDGLENVAYQAQIYLHSSVTFDHTYETTLYSEPGSVGIATTVTEEKTLTEFTVFDVIIIGGFIVIYLLGISSLKRRFCKRDEHIRTTRCINVCPSTPYLKSIRKEI